MKYFNESEFQGWYHQLDEGLKNVLDNFRYHWGAPVTVSPAVGAVGRKLGASRSGHNVDKWGKVLACDLFPKGMNTAVDRKRAFECAVKAGALGFGVYPDWNPVGGIHLDMVPRAGRGVGNPARWSAFKVNGVQTYFALDIALDKAFE